MHCTFHRAWLRPLSVALVSLSIGAAELAADWPTYLHDATRVGSSDERLALPLRAAWQFRSAAAPRTAWPAPGRKLVEGKELRHRVRYDDALQVAAGGGAVYFGSSVDHCVRSLDATSGELLWQFFTGGPVRLAPTLADGRLYFGSDDGNVYCLSAVDGKLLWQRRVGPRDERVLARGQMISRWPVRTGVLVDGGTAYFGAGIFPHETVYLVAADAVTGDIVWKNDAISQRDAGRNDLTPQGYLLASDRVLFVPSGRTMPAAFDRETGKLLHKAQPSWRRDGGGQVGGTRALLADEQIYSVGEHHVLALDQRAGRTGFGWLQARQMTLAGGRAYLASGKEIVAVDRVPHAKASRARHAIELTLDQQRKDLARHPVAKHRAAAKAAEASRDAARRKLAALTADDPPAEKPEAPAVPETTEKPKAPATTEQPETNEASETPETTEQPQAPAEKAVADARDALARAETALVTATAKHEVSRLDREQRQKRYDADRARVAELAAAGVVWRAELPHESALIVAGDAVVAGGAGEVAILDALTGKVRARHAVAGEARGLAVADGRLLVSTTEGRLYAFAAERSAGLPGRPPEPKRERAANRFSKQADRKPTDDAGAALHREAAAEILRRSDVTRGYGLVLESAEAGLARELARQSELTIYCLLRDAAQVAAARRALADEGLYGTRVIVDRGDLSTLPHASYFADLIVCEGLLESPTLRSDPAEIARLVKPHGGVICLGGPKGDDEATAAIDRWFAATGLAPKDADEDAPGAVRREGRWALLTRGALPGAADWTHQYGSAGATASNDDRRLRGGLRVLWYGDPGPRQMLNRHVGAVGPVSADGRLFVQGEESILAYDAYNGRFLWELKNPGALRNGVFNNHEPGNLAAGGGYLFATNVDRCQQIEAATGDVIRTYTAPPGAAEEPRQWAYVAYHDGLLYAASSQRELWADAARRRGKVTDRTATDRLIAFDPGSGREAWSYRGGSIAHNTLAIGDGRVLMIDSTITPQQREALLRQDKSELAALTGDAREKAEARLKRIDARTAVALDARTGEKLWAVPVDVTDCSGVGIGAGKLTLMLHDNHVVLCGANANGHYWKQFLTGEFQRRRLVVLDARSGEKMWARDANYRHRPIVVGQRIIAEPWAFHLSSGEQETRPHPLTGEPTPWKFARPGHHCGAISASASMMFYRSGTTAYYDLEADSGTAHFAGHRTGCWINAIPAGGLVLVPEASAGCVCLFSIASTVAFEPDPRRTPWGVYSAEGGQLPVRHLALNFAAPGDRRDARGRLWLAYPRPSSRAGIDLPLQVEMKFHPGVLSGARYVAGNGESLAAEAEAVVERPWVVASTARGVIRCRIPLRAEGDAAARYRVRLHFAAAPGEEPSGRSFDVRLQGETVREGLDVAARTAGKARVLVEEFADVPVERDLVVEFAPQGDEASTDRWPRLSGLELLQLDAPEARP